MTVWVLDRGEPDWEARELITEAGRRGHEACFVGLDILEASSAGLVVRGVPVEIPEHVFVRSQVFTRSTRAGRAADLAILSLLESLGARLVSSAASTQLCANKLTLSAMLGAHGLPTPETRAVRTLSQVKELGCRWPAFVVKPVYGHASIDVFGVGVVPRGPDGDLNERELIHVHHLLANHGELVAQELVYAREEAFTTARVCLIGTTLAAAYSLHATATMPDWPGKTIPALERHVLADLVRLEAVARAAQSALDLASCTVDLVAIDGQYLVIEVNPMVSVWESWGDCRLVEKDPAALHLDLIAGDDRGTAEPIGIES